MKESDFPNEFLGRCQTCLDNAFLNNEPCQIGYGNGQPVVEDDCLVRRTQRHYLKEKSAEVAETQ